MRIRNRVSRGPALAGSMLLSVVLVDELVCGLEVLYLPRIRDHFTLSYGQTGLLMSVGLWSGVIVEPVLLAMAARGSWRMWLRRGLVLIALAGVAMALAPSYAFLVAAFALSGPLSGLVCCTSEATLVKMNPQRSRRVMTQWCMWGSVGDVIGPAMVAVLAWAQIGWREALLLGAALWAMLLIVLPLATGDRATVADRVDTQTVRSGTWLGAFAVLGRPGVLVTAIPMSLLSLFDEVLLALAVLYLCDHIGVGPAVANVAVGAMLVTALLVAVAVDRLEARRVRPRRALICVSLVSLAGVLALFLASNLWQVMGALVLLAFGLAPYPFLKAAAYDAAPGRAADVEAALSLFNPIQASLPWLMGLAADWIGLRGSILILAVAPLAVLAVSHRCTPRSIGEAA